MMLKQITSAFFLVIAAHAVGARAVDGPVVGTSIPKYATQLEKFSNYENIAQGTMRVRVSVATDTLSSERNVRIGDVLLCSNSSCYRAHTTGYVDMINTGSGAASAIADAALPVGVKITDVFFTETNKGASALTGHLALKTPMITDRQFASVELLVGVHKKQPNGAASYLPVHAVSAYFHPDNSLVYYLPSLQTVAKLPLGGVLTIPAGATSEPQIFNVSESDVGNIYPSIDIYPYITLNKPATIEVSPIAGGASTHEMIVPVYPQDQKALLAPPIPSTSKKARVTILRMDSIHPRFLEDAALGKPQAAASGTTPDATTTCAGIVVAHTGPAERRRDPQLSSVASIVERFIERP